MGENEFFRDGQDILQVSKIKNLNSRSFSFLVERSDLLKIKVEEGGNSLFILRQKYHPDWQARVYVDSAWKDVSVEKVRGFFTGIVLPPGTETLELKFLPYAKYSWISHVFWSCLFVVILYRFYRLRKQCPLL